MDPAKADDGRLQNVQYSNVFQSIIAMKKESNKESESREGGDNMKTPSAPVPPHKYHPT
jgi:hypothetical protein